MFVSVVIPLYNAKDTIVSTLESILNQSYREIFEIIIVNDGSSDGGEKLVENIISTNMRTNRVIKLITKPNGGVSSARNVGIKEAEGEWIALLDSDDIWLATKLEKQINEIKNNEDIEFIGTNRNNEVYPYFAKSKNRIYFLNVKEIITKWHPHTSTALIKKNILMKVGLYDESRTHAEDGDLWLRISKYCTIYVFNENLVYTGGGKRSFGESGLSANISKMFKGELLALKGAKRRKQINFLEYPLFYIYLSLKYFRRIFIVWKSK